MQFKNILLLLSQQGPDYGADSVLVSRAVELCKTHQAHLHLLQIVDTSPQFHSAFEASAYQEMARLNSLELEQQKLQRLVDHLGEHKDLSVSMHCEHGLNRADAVLAHADTINADLILKQSRDERYLLGLFDNTDWQLLRDAQCPVWLNCNDKGPADGVVAAIECQLQGPECGSDRYELDDRVFTLAKLLSDAYTAPLFLVHAYEVPQSDSFLGYAPTIPSEPTSPAVLERLYQAEDRQAEQISQLHGHAIRTFVNEHGIPVDDIDVVNGVPADVIQRKASEHGAGLIVMGASGDRSRWDRVFQKVTAEATLDGAPCDILFIH